jgi:hypothetical protein
LNVDWWRRCSCLACPSSRSCFIFFVSWQKNSISTGN